MDERKKVFIFFYSLRSNEGLAQFKLIKFIIQRTRFITKLKTFFSTEFYRIETVCTKSFQLSRNFSIKVKMINKRLSKIDFSTKSICRDAHALKLRTNWLVICQICYGNTYKTINQKKKIQRRKEKTFLLCRVRSVSFWWDNQESSFE